MFRGMDPGIWSRLPADLLDRILCCLPLMAFLRLRSTCKHFHSLLFSPSFVSKHSVSSSFPSFLLLSHPQLFPLQFPLFHAGDKAWRKPPLCPSAMLPSTPSSSAPVLLSASNGLLCFSLPASSSFVVCNLLAGTSRAVRYPTQPFHFELTSLVPTPNGYKLFSMSASSSSSSSFIYDSVARSWRRLPGLEHPVLGGVFRQEGVLWRGMLHFVTREPFRVVLFDPEQGKWESWGVDLPGELVFARLLSDGCEKLYLVGGVGRNGISRSIKLWEYDQGSWEEAGNVPELMCRKFVSVCYHNYEQVYCLWHQGLICVCCSTWPEVLYLVKSRGTWHWLPKCPSLPMKWSCGFKWFSFAPQLCDFV